jgi:CheY-like chemotaxis protein
VVIAADGLEAVRQLERAEFDVVLMDEEMPRMNGLEATARIRERERETGGHVPIVALTAHATQGDRRRFLGHGMDDHLAKPFELPQLVVVFDRLFPDDWSPEACPVRRIGAHRQPRIVDPDVLMERVGGDRELLQQLVDTFRTERGSILDELAEAASIPDPGRIERAAIRLRSSLGTLGADAAAALAQDIEDRGREGRLDEIEEALRSLAETIVVVEEDLGVIAGANAV